MFIHHETFSAKRASDEGGPGYFDVIETEDGFKVYEESAVVARAGTLRSAMAEAKRQAAAFDREAREEAKRRKEAEQRRPFEELAARHPFPAWVDYSRELWGRHWVLAPRLTDYLQSRGYERAVSSKEYDALQRLWQDAHPIMRELDALPAGPMADYVREQMRRHLDSAPTA